MSIERGVLALLFVVSAIRLAQAEFRIECSMLPVEECAFAVSHSGERCVLEKQVGSDHKECQTSNIVVGNDALVDYVETDNCVSACGADRTTIGFASDGISSPNFMERICSQQCRETCLNLIDLYSNIIAGEGASLSEFCGEQRRSMLLKSRRVIALSPTHLSALSPSQRNAMSPV